MNLGYQLAFKIKTCNGVIHVYGHDHNILHYCVPVDMLPETSLVPTWKRIEGKSISCVRIVDMIKYDKFDMFIGAIREHILNDESRSFAVKDTINGGDATVIIGNGVNTQIHLQRVMQVDRSPYDANRRVDIYLNGDAKLFSSYYCIAGQLPPYVWRTRSSTIFYIGEDRTSPCIRVMDIEEPVHVNIADNLQCISDAVRAYMADQTPKEYTAEYKYRITVCCGLDTNKVALGLSALNYSTNDNTKVLKCNTLDTNNKTLNLGVDVESMLVELNVTNQDFDLGGVKNEQGLYVLEITKDENKFYKYDHVAHLHTDVLDQMDALRQHGYIVNVKYAVEMCNDNILQRVCLYMRQCCAGVVNDFGYISVIDPTNYIKSLTHL